MKCLWNVTETSQTVRHKHEGRLYTCARQKSFTLVNQRVLEIDPNKHAEGDNDLEENNDVTMHHPTRKLSESDIKRVSKFLDYDKGQPIEVSEAHPRYLQATSGAFF